MIKFSCQAVLFDMDGTILDSFASANRAWGKWAASAGLGDGFTLEGSHHGRQRPDVIRIEKPDYNAVQVAEAAEYIRLLEIKDTDGVVALAGSADLMTMLPDSRWAIVTSADREVCVARVQAAGLPLPKVIVTADDAPRSKPDPMGYLMAADALGFSPADCVVMEDAPAGIAAGKAAGMLVIATRHTQPDEALGTADAIVDNPSDVTAEITTDNITLTVRT